MARQPQAQLDLAGRLIMGAPPMTALERAIGDLARAMKLVDPYLKNMPEISTSMTAQQARLLEVLADKWGLASDCLAVVARLRLKELREGSAND